MKVDFNRQYVSGNEIKYIEEVISSGLTSGDNIFTRKASALLESKYDFNKVLLTTSASTALELACMLAKITDHEVIMPSFTFPSTANAVLLNGGMPVFADIDENYNLCLDDLESKITSKTKAIIVVHYAGTSCDMDRLVELAAKHKLIIIEDAAQAINAKYKDKYLGSIGDFGILSFHQTKNISCGEGGCLIINSDSSKVNDAEIIREKGTNRASFIRGDISFYNWVNVGSSMLPSDILAAHLLAQLEQVDLITSKRMKVFNRYYEAFSELAINFNFRFIRVPEYNTTNGHIFYLILPSQLIRNRLMNYLKDRGISSYFHYIPLHSSPKGREIAKDLNLEVTEEKVDCLLRLPIYPDLGEKEQEYVLEQVEIFFKLNRDNI